MDVWKQNVYYELKYSRLLNSADIFSTSEKVKMEIIFLLEIT